MTRHAPPTIQETIDSSEDDSSDDLVISPPLKSNRRAPPLAQPVTTTATSEVTGVTIEDDDETVSVSGGDEKNETSKKTTTKRQRFEIPDTSITEDMQKELLKTLTGDPSKITAALRELNVDGDTLNKVVEDVRRDPETMKEMENLAKQGNIQDELRKNLSKGQSKGRGDSIPKRKKILKMQKNMKKAMKDGVTDTEKKEEIIGVTINSGRKAKSISLKKDDVFDDAARKLGYNTVGMVSLTNDIIAVYCTTNQRRNKRIEKILGPQHGCEVVFYKRGGNLTVDEFEKIETTLKVATDDAQGTQDA